MTIHYVLAYKGGAGKSHIAILLARVLPDPIVIEHAGSGAADAWPAFPVAEKIRFTGSPEEDMLALENAIQRHAGHQNIVINTPPAMAFPSLVAHADLIRPMGEQYGHASRAFLVVDDTAPFDTSDILTALHTFGTDLRVVFNEKTAGRQWAREGFLGNGEIHAAIEELGTPLCTIPRLPHRAIGDYLRTRAPGTPLVTRVLAQRYLDACDVLANP